MSHTVVRFKSATDACSCHTMFHTYDFLEVIVRFVILMSGKFYVTGLLLHSKALQGLVHSLPPQSGRNPYARS